MAKKYTVNITAVFESESYAEAQTYLINQLTADEEKTRINIQRLDLIQWSDPVANKPIDARTGKPIVEDDE